MNSKTVTKQYLELSKEKLNTLNSSILDLYNLVYSKEIKSKCGLANYLNTLTNDNHIDESFMSNYSLIKDTLKSYSSRKEVDISLINNLNNSIDLLISEINESRSEYLEGLNKWN